MNAIKRQNDLLNKKLDFQKFKKMESYSKTKFVSLKPKKLSSIKAQVVNYEVQPSFQLESRKLNPSVIK